jgi:cobalt/nickel transport system permease protein
VFSAGYLPFAVHISDGVLTFPWLVGGFVVAAVLILYGSFRIRDEEIPRIALLAAAFFVASLIHVRLGPTSVHLLLNGLVGVILGRRAALAIPLGLGLQAVLIGHGGYTTLGVNSCVLTLPALLAGWLSAALARLPWMRRPFCQFLLGLFVGVTGVLVTLLLNAAVLLWGGAEDWHALVALVFLAHLPIVMIEGIVLGFTVSFLVRVKPEMLGEYARRWSEPSPSRAERASENGYYRPSEEVTADRDQIKFPPALLFAAAISLAWTGTAHAHRLNAEYRVLPEKRVRIESWFDIGGDPPVGAKVQVLHRGKELLTEGIADEKGNFVFSFDEAEDLTVVVSVVGHRAELTIPKAALLEPGAEPGPDSSSPSSTANRTSRVEVKDVLTGLAFLLALAAFVLSWRNARILAELKRHLREG